MPLDAASLQVSFNKKVDLVMEEQGPVGCVTSRLFSTCLSEEAHDGPLDEYGHRYLSIKDNVLKSS